MRRKRAYLIGALGLALALAVSSVAISAPADQQITGEVGGKTKPKFPKKEFKKTGIEVRVTTTDAANPSGIPPKATRTQVGLDGDLKFNTGVVDKCEQSQIENTTTEAAQQACGDAKIGGGNAVVALPTGSGGARQDFAAVVTAYNGAGGKRILLHSRVNDLGTTAVLVGVLKKGAPAGRANAPKQTLDVTVPPIGGGVGAIADFRVKVKKGKYVTARCKDKKFHFSAVTDYTDAPRSTDTFVQACKRKAS